MARKEADDVHMLPKWLISTKICAEWYRYLPSAITWDRLLPLVPHKQRECQLQTRHSFSGYGDLHFRNAAGVVIRLSSYAPLPTEIFGLIRGKRSALRVSWQRWRVSKKPLMRNSSPMPSSPPPLLYCAFRFARLRASCYFVPYTL